MRVAQATPFLGSTVGVHSCSLFTVCRFIVVHLGIPARFGGPDPGLAALILAPAAAEASDIPFVSSVVRYGGTLA